MSYPVFQYALLRQKERDLELELQRERLAATVSRMRPPLRHQLGAALVRLGARFADSEPPQLTRRQTPCHTA